MEAAIQAAAETRVTRRYRTVEERRRIVEETLAGGVSVAVVARRHGVNANQVFHWRKLYHSGLLAPPIPERQLNASRLLPVTVVDEAEFGQTQRQRKKVEALFAELKSHSHIGLHRLRLRRLKFVREQFFLAATAQNIKRLVRFLGRPTISPVPATS